MTVFEQYIHGYHSDENERLDDQAGTLVDLLHSDTGFPAGAAILEVGCGVGAQTIILAQRSRGGCSPASTSRPTLSPSLSVE